MILPFAVLLASALDLATPEAQEPKAATKFESADEAFRAGVAYLQLKEVAKSQEPLEQALKLAPDDKYRIRVYEALTEAYRQLPEPDKMIEALEFIIDKTDSDAKRSLTRRAMLGFVYQRGKVEPFIQRYEATLKKDPNHKTAIYILTDAYDRLKSDPKRATELLERQIALAKKAGEKVETGTEARLAGLYVKTGRAKDAAELFERLAKQDEKQSAANWKEAASAWLKAGDKAKALAAAKASDSSPGERPTGLNGYYWYTALGDVYLQVGDAKLAVGHYEAALKNAIPAHQAGAQKKLDEARAKSGGK